MNQNRIISLHVGNGGIKIAQELYSLYVKEHNIMKGYQIPRNDSNLENQNLQTMFHSQQSIFDSKERKLTARAIFIDIDDSFFNDFQKPQFQNILPLFRPKNMQTAYLKKGTQRNFAKAIKQKNLIGIVKQRIMEQIKLCQNFNGMMVYHTASGGTSSGILFEILRWFKNEMPNKLICNFIINPDFSDKSQRQIDLESYNCCLTYSVLDQFSDMVFCYDNSKVKKLCQSQLKIQNPTERQINRLICHCIADVTYNFRNDSPLNSNLTQIQANLVPYPQIKYLSSFLTPIGSDGDPLFYEKTLIDTFKPVVFHSLCLSDFDFYYSCNFAVAALYRGNIVPKNVGPTIQFLKTNRYFKFVDWAPTGFKCSLQYQPITLFDNDDRPPISKQSLLICNNAGIMQTFDVFMDNFSNLMKNKAYWQEFQIQGFDTNILKEVQDTLKRLQQDYDQATADSTSQNQDDM